MLSPLTQTVAFTATLTQIASDPYLFALSFSPVDKYRNSRLEKQQAERSLEAAESKEGRKARVLRTLGRDRRMLGILSLCTGAGVAECILYSRAGLRGGLTIAACFKLIQAVSRCVDVLIPSHYLHLLPRSFSGSTFRKVKSHKTSSEIYNQCNITIYQVYNIMSPASR